jgi:hypothetical protein
MLEIPASVNAVQNNWVFCRKCLGLFWNGLPHNGHCPAGGAHAADSFNFYLLADGSPNSRIVKPDTEPVGP